MHINTLGSTEFEDLFWIFLICFGVLRKRLKKNNKFCSFELVSTEMLAQVFLLMEIKEKVSIKWQSKSSWDKFGNRQQNREWVAEFSVT